MRVLIGYSTCQHTREAFERHGHEVWTCDLRPAPGKHWEGDVWTLAEEPGWDLGIFHPPCTYLTTSAAWAFEDGPYHQEVQPGTLVGAERREAREAAIEEFRRLLRLPYPKCIENPARSYVSAAIRPPDQTIQPYNFGDDASKMTGLWLDQLPLLENTRFVPGRVVEWPAGSGRLVHRWSNQTDNGQNRLSPGEDRWLERSLTYPGIARAMGDQWGGPRRQLTFEF